MKLKTIPYSKYETQLPQEGHHILAQQTEDTVFVYQAFNPRIANYAVKHQKFGGEHYKFSRMSWIKPNFLWMMYRCGWALKENQKKVLAIEIKKTHFDLILSKAIFSSFKTQLYSSREEWQEDIKNSDVRLQWDPDHHPNGEKLKRRAIQLGLRGEILHQFGTEWIVSIEDITDFVLAQGKKLKTDFEDLEVIEESIYPITSEITRKRIII